MNTQNFQNHQTNYMHMYKYGDMYVCLYKTTRRIEPIICFSYLEGEILRKIQESTLIAILETWWKFSLQNFRAYLFWKSFDNIFQSDIIWKGFSYFPKTIAFT